MYKSATLTADNGIEILKLLSENLDSPIDKENNEYCINIPEELGSGDIKAVKFENGITLMLIDVLLKKSFRIRFKKKELNPLTIIFNTKSAIKHADSSADKKMIIDSFESLMFSNNFEDCNTLLIEKEKPTSLVQIYINRKEFEPKLSDFSESISPDLETLFKDVNGVNFFNYKGHYSLDISEALDAIKNCEKEGLMRSLFMESKTYEILTFHFQQYTDDGNDPENRTIMRRATKEKVHKAVELIKNEMASTMSVNQIAKKVGLNQNTLQNGFQKLFNSSVNDYIKETRIEEAKRLIENSDMNITEITYAIGVNSRSYFSKLFKEKYKTTPNEYLKKVRKDKPA